MRKIKVILIHSEDFFEYYESMKKLLWSADETPWQDVSELEFEDLQDLVKYHNRNFLDSKILVVEFVPEGSVEGYLKRAKESLDLENKRLEAKRNKDLEAKKKREESAVKRKAAQLEKLKKELGVE